MSATDSSSAPSFESLSQQIVERPRRWLVTGAAGFIGSHLVERLLELNQEVVGIDDFSTGRRENLHLIEHAVGSTRWQSFHFLEGSVVDTRLLTKALQGVEHVLHQGALGSVPRSVADPLSTTRANVEGSVAVFFAAREAGLNRVVYASSSSVYGTDNSIPRREFQIGQPLSPYAASKLADELFAQSFAHSYGIQSVGLRYFNVFGPRQDPNGQYAAVIPRWILQLIAGEACTLFGDGESTRDFCYIENVVRANLQAALVPNIDGAAVLNIGAEAQTTLLKLYQMLCDLVQNRTGKTPPSEPTFAPFRVGDVRYSQADISLAKRIIAYQPAVSFEEGLQKTVGSFLALTPKNE